MSRSSSLRALLTCPTRTLALFRICSGNKHPVLPRPHRAGRRGCHDSMPVPILLIVARARRLREMGQVPSILGFSYRIDHDGRRLWYRPQRHAPPPAFTIARTANPPDGIVGHAYSAYIATSLAGGNTTADVVTACSLTGSAPAGMTAAPGTLPGLGATPYYCVLTISSAAAPGQYNFTLRAADSSTPPQTTSRAYTLTIRPDFIFTTSTLAQGVQGRSYGIAPLSQPEATNVGTTQGSTTVGNGPLPVFRVPARSRRRRR